MPFLAILAAAMISRAASDGFEWLYPLRIVAAAAALWYFRKSYRDLDFHFGWLGAAAGIGLRSLDRLRSQFLPQLPPRCFMPQARQESPGLRFA